jgi:hypothetical protein
MQCCHMSVLILEPRLMSSSFTGWRGRLLCRFDNAIGLADGGGEGMGDISARGGS